MEMSEIIKNLRTQRGLTQEELGKIIGVQKSAIRKYESGMVENMKRSSIVKLAKYFNVTPSFLLGYEENFKSLSKEQQECCDLIKNLNNIQCESLKYYILGLIGDENQKIKDENND